MCNSDNSHGQRDTRYPNNTHKEGIICTTLDISIWSSKMDLIVNLLAIHQIYFMAGSITTGHEQYR